MTSLETDRPQLRMWKPKDIEPYIAEEAYVPALEHTGYFLRIREQQWHEHRMFRGPVDTNVNLHCFSDGCPEILRMVRFRDRLSESDADRRLYERAKRDLAANIWTLVQSYADAKTAVVEEILARAHEGD